MDISTTPGEIVKEWRRGASVTVESLASKVGLGVGPVKMIEANRRKLSPVEAERIAKALKMKPRPLLAAIERAERPMLYVSGGGAEHVVRLADLVMGPNDRPRALGSWAWENAIAAVFDDGLKIQGLPFDVSDLLPAFTVTDGIARIGSRPAVRYVDGKPTVIYGERRCWAALVLGAHSIAVDVHDVSDADAMRMHYMENAARQDFPPLADAAELARFAALGLAPDAIASRVGRTTEHVLRRLTLLRAIEPVREAVARGPVESGCTLEVGEFFGRHDPARQAHAWPRAVAQAELRKEPVRLTANVRALLASLPLASAPWPLDDRFIMCPDTTHMMSACAGCPKRSDAQQTIPGVEPVGSECLDVECYEAKGAAWEARKRLQQAPAPNDCPECEYERAHGEVGPYDHHTCDTECDTGIDPEPAERDADDMFAEHHEALTQTERHAPSTSRVGTYDGVDNVRTEHVHVPPPTAPDPRIAEVRAVLEAPPHVGDLIRWCMETSPKARDILEAAAGEPITWLDAQDDPRAPAILAALLAAIALDRGGAPARTVRAWLSPPAPEVACTCGKPKGVRGRHKEACAKSKEGAK